MRYSGLLIACCITLSINTYAQLGTILKTEEVYEGATLFHPNGSTDTYLVDNDGRLLHQWEGTFLPGVAVYLLENGQLLRSGRVEDGNDFAGGRGGRLELVEWDGTISWSYEISSAQEKLHHDMQYLPNGNILAIVWEVRTNEEAIEAGRNPETVETGIWPDKIMELRPIGTNDAEIVWEWNAWDHLIQDFDSEKFNFGVVAENPGKIDINYDDDTDPDWLHFNGLDYNEELDQIMISVPEYDEVWVIDHSTTTMEAASDTGGNLGKGGDIVYRWGNPEAYDRGSVEDKKFFYQHHTTWLFEDNQWKAMLYNNGRDRPDGLYSSIDKLILPINQDGSYAELVQPTDAHGPIDFDWTYTAENPTDLYDAFVSSAQQLPNGNIVICSGVSGEVFEINASDDIVWRYNVPISSSGEIFCLNEEDAIASFVFRVEKFPFDYPGLGPISDLGLLEGEDCVVLGVAFDEAQVHVSYASSAIKVTANKPIRQAFVFDLNGSRIAHKTFNSDDISLESLPLSKGIYVVNLVFDDATISSNKLMITGD